MKFEREKQKFQPIKITFETEREANDFISLIDKIESNRNNSGRPPEINAAEYTLVVKISEFFTDTIGLRPAK
jgi:hypothetical protein